MPHRDSIDKIVTSYFAPIAAAPFTWRGEQYRPKPLTVRADVFRGFTCPAGCGGCCPTFTLDWLPFDKHPPMVALPRFIDFDGRAVMVLSDLQQDNRGLRCHNLTSEGRCGIHGLHPFSCDFELIRFHRTPSGYSATTRLFSRGWAMKRTDGGQGALCELLPRTPGWAEDVARKMRRLGDWADHFGLEHRVGEIVAWAEQWQSEPERAPDLTMV